MEENLQARRKEAATTIKAIRQRIRWKPGKAAAHLEKRKALGHLPVESSVEEYNYLSKRGFVLIGAIREALA